MADTRPLTPDPESRKLFFVAGEVSGDIQAAYLIGALKARDPAVEIVGVGGPRMAAAGASVVSDSSEWGVIGHLTPILRAPQYIIRLRDVAAAVRRAQPDLLILVDFPGFNLRLAGALRGRVPVVYYFPPMVSVRRGDRARRIAALGMHLIATLPFEAEAYRAAGADVTFVGHPALDTVRPALEPEVRRSRLGLRAGSRVVGLLPGSRAQEITMHLPPMLDAAAGLARQYPDLEFVLPCAAAHLRRRIEETVAHAGAAVHVTTDVFDAMAESSVLITASGTATLEAAVLGVPMVVVYRLPALSWRIAMLLLSTRIVALPNLLAGRLIVPELLQYEMTPQRMVTETADLLSSPARRVSMAADLQAAVARLGPPGAIARAADEVLALLDPPGTTR